MIHLIKRIFCKHTYKICTFPLKILDKWVEADCTDIRGKSLCECTKCGKKRVIITS